MSAPPPPREDESARFSTVLEALASRPGDRLTLREMVDAFGERAFGAVLLLVSLINLLPLPPGGTTVTGAPLLLIALQLAIGRDTLWLPRRLLDAAVSRSNFARGVARVRPVLRAAERLSRPRLPGLATGAAERLIGVVCAVLAFVLILPIPFGNFVPAFTCALFSLALMQRDGVAALAGWGMTGVTVGILAVVWRTVQRAVERLLPQAWEWLVGLFPGV